MICVFMLFVYRSIYLVVCMSFFLSILFTYHHIYVSLSTSESSYFSMLFLPRMYAFYDLAYHLQSPIFVSWFPSYFVYPIFVVLVQILMYCLFVCLLAWLVGWLFLCLFVCLFVCPISVGPRQWIL